MQKKKKTYTLIIHEPADTGSEEIKKLNAFVQRHKLASARLNYYYCPVYAKSELSAERLQKLLLELMTKVRHIDVRYAHQKDGEYVIVQLCNYWAPKGYLMEYKTGTDQSEYRLMIGPACGYVLGVSADNKVVIERDFAGFDNSRVLNGFANINDTALAPERLLDVIKGQNDVAHGYTQVRLEDIDARRHPSEGGDDISNAESVLQKVLHE